MTPLTPDTNASRAAQTDYDIAIIGAGPAGIAAASAAAKSARVILIDSAARLGGSVTTAMHRSMCGLYSRTPRDPLDTLNDGAQRDVVRRMLDKDPPYVRPREMGKAWVLEFPTALWESSLAQIVAESNADLRLNSRVTELRRESNRITGFLLSPSSQWITPKILIDCTGAGHVLNLAGKDTYQPPEPPDERMLAGFCIRLSNITGDPELLRLQIPYFLAQAVEKNLLPPTARFTSFYPGPAQGEGVCKLALNLASTSPSQARALADQLFAHLITPIPALASSQIIEYSASILPRDGLRIFGKYTLTEQDVLQSRRHGPGSVHAWWPVEKWHISTGPTYAYPEVGQHYDIPPDALRSATIENLLAAGTCLSATASAAASSRASGICLATGHAAGKLALTILNSQKV